MSEIDYLSSSKLVAIVQARLGSTRFPRKCLASICGKPMLAHVLDRLKNCKQVESVIVATSDEPTDDEIEKYCAVNHVECFRGSQLKVLNRLVDAAEHYGVKRFLRVCSDNPLLDSSLIDNQIRNFAMGDDYCAYYSADGNSLILSPVGVFAECVTVKALRAAAQFYERDPMTQEHVTFPVYKNEHLFAIRKLAVPFNFEDLELRFTVDFLDDINIVEYVINNYFTESFANIVKQVRSDAGFLKKLNSHYKKFKKTY